MNEERDCVHPDLDPADCPRCQERRARKRCSVSYKVGEHGWWCYVGGNVVLLHRDCEGCQAVLDGMNLSDQVRLDTEALS